MTTCLFLTLWMTGHLGYVWGWKNLNDVAFRRFFFSWSSPLALLALSRFSRASLSPLFVKSTQKNTPVHQTTQAEIVLRCRAWRTEKRIVLWRLLVTCTSNDYDTLVALFTYFVFHNNYWQLFTEVEVNSTWLITSELANQRARKVLFTWVVYTNYCSERQERVFKWQSLLCTS